MNLESFLEHNIAQPSWHSMSGPRVVPSCPHKHSQPRSLHNAAKPRHGFSRFSICKVEVWKAARRGRVALQATEQALAFSISWRVVMDLDGGKLMVCN